MALQENGRLQEKAARCKKTMSAAARNVFADARRLSNPTTHL